MAPSERDEKLTSSSVAALRRDYNMCCLLVDEEWFKFRCATVSTEADGGRRAVVVSFFGDQVVYALVQGSVHRSFDILGHF